MISNTLLRVDRLTLHNFRCFAECAIDFHPELTVLVAENGRGKTAILDAIGIALGMFVDGIANTRHRGFERSDVHLGKSDAGEMRPALPTEFGADGYVAGQALHWSRSLLKYSLHARTTTKDVRRFRQYAEQLRPSLDAPTAEAAGSPSMLPLVAFYGTGRLWSEHRLTEGKRSHSDDSNGRLSGYADCLSSSSSFQGVTAWYEGKMTEIGDPRFAREQRENLSLVTAVQEAVRVVLEPTGWRDLVWANEQRSLVVEHPKYGRLPLSSLSDGVRNMIALIGDIAHRCARLNPYLGEQAARKTSGVLLIDEVDMHLHPQWQQLVVDLLRLAFPSLQIILSTHSPHVLSTVNKESIRVIRLQDAEGSIQTPVLQTRGVISADVLASIMGVDPTPPITEATWLSRYQELIEDGGAQSDEAQSLRSRLVNHFGASHPVIANSDRLIRFQAFRLERKGPKGE